MIGPTCITIFVFTVQARGPNEFILALFLERGERRAALYMLTVHTCM